MGRLTNEQLDKIKDEYGVDRIWSWSRVNTFMTSPYEYMLHYVKNVPEDREDCAYATLGTISHDTIDAFYEGQIKYEDMLDRFKDGWITAIDVINLKLDRNDEEKDIKLKKKYYENLIRFFSDHTVYKHELAIEKPITAKIGDNVFVGYIDGMYKDDEGVYHILDFKTSTKYSGKGLEEHSGQLTIYAIGLMQTGVPLEKIRACFNFLKYVTIQYQQKNGSVKTRDIERCKVGESLQSNARMWLKEFGYEDEADEYLMNLLDSNSIDVLPEEVRSKYVVEDCHVYIPLDSESVAKWEDIINKTIKDIYKREKKFAETKDENAFWDTNKSVEEQSYYFATLSGYSALLHKPYQKYLERLEMQKNKFDFFGGTRGSEPSNNVDLSWLDNL